MAPNPTEEREPKERKRKRRTRNQKASKSQEGGKLRLATFNVQSLHTRSARLRQVNVINDAISHGIHILALQDTKCRGSVTEEWAPAEGGRNWLYLPSGVGEGEIAKAGVSFLVNPDWLEKIREHKAVSNRICYLRLESQVFKGVILNVYAPSREKHYAPFLRELESVINAIPMRIDESFVLMGDMNAQVGGNRESWSPTLGPQTLGKENKKGGKLLQFLSRQGLCILNSYFTRRAADLITWQSQAKNPKSPVRSSTIDYVVVPVNQRGSWVNIMTSRNLTHESDHSMVIVTHRGIMQKRKAPPEKIVQYRNEVLTNSRLARTSLQRVVTKEYSKSPDASLEEDWLNFRNTLANAARKECGVVTRTIGNRKNRTAWWTKEVQKEVGQKRAAWREWSKNLKMQALRIAYQKAKQRCKQAIRQAKEAAATKLAEKISREWAEKGRRKFYETIRRCRGMKRETSNTVNDETENSEVSERFRRHFESLLGNKDQPETALPQFENRTNRSDPINSEAITLEEVTKAVRKLKSGKAAGKDGIRGEWLRLKAAGISGELWLHRICQKSWESGLIPTDWDLATIVPLFKKGDSKVVTNYRGISLLSIPGKIYSRVLQKRVQMCTDGYLQEEQAGFRNGRSTSDQLFVVRMLLDKARDKNRNLYLAFVDLETAYDRVPRELMWETLSKYGVCEKLLLAIKSLYRDSQNSVRVGEKFSSTFQTHTGLRQGCNLSPTLFLVFMDRIL